MATSNQSDSGILLYVDEADVLLYVDEADGVPNIANSAPVNIRLAKPATQA